MFIQIKENDRMIEVANSLNPKWFKKIEYYVDELKNESFTIVDMHYMTYCFIHNFRSTTKNIKQLHNILRGVRDEAKGLSTKSS